MFNLLLPLVLVPTYLDIDEFEADFYERNVYLVKNRKTLGFVWTCEMLKLWGRP